METIVGLLCLVGVSAILFNQRKIMASIQEATAAVNALNAQVTKIRGEIQALIDAVANGGAGQTSPEFDAALTALTSNVQGADDMNRDPEPEPEEPPAP